MKIFLNDRFVEFLSRTPENILPADLLTVYQSHEELKESWENFRRYEKYQRLVVVDPSIGSKQEENSVAFIAFCSFFKLINAAGGLVKNEKGEFLFIHRFGMWDLPKGKVNKKDREVEGNSKESSLVAKNAAVREVKEETGLKQVDIIRELQPTWHIYLEKNRWNLKLTRWFEMEASSGQSLTPQTIEGIFLVKWTSPKDLHCVLGKTYASIRELLVETLF